MAANGRLDQMTQSAGTFTGYQRQPLTPDWPSQGGSAGSNPVGATRKTAADQAWYHHQPACISSDRPSGTREGRTNSRRWCFGTLQINFACRNTSTSAGGVVLSRGWTPAGTSRRPGTTRLDDQASKGLPNMSATTKHVRSALRTAGVDRSSRSSVASLTSDPELERE